VKVGASALLVAFAALAVPTPAAAHGLGGIRDLPVPGWLFLVGGATVLVVSFVALGALWKTPKLDENVDWPLPEALQRFLLSPWTPPGRAGSVARILRPPLVGGGVRFGAYGKGWNLLGSVGFKPNLSLLSRT